jgi:HSP20 family molecular chaperone IbpA
MRTIPFAEEVDGAKINAEYKDGVLTLKLPKKPFDAPRTNKITIK